MKGWLLDQFHSSDAPLLEMPAAPVPSSPVPRFTKLFDAQECRHRPAPLPSAFSEQLESLDAAHILFFHT